MERFADGKGVLITATNVNKEFRELRKTVLGITEFIIEQLPHITLMYPRNSTCNYEIFVKILKQVIPNELFFSKISLIEQNNGGKWNVINEINFVTKNKPKI